MRKAIITICCILVFCLLATTVFLRVAVHSRQVGPEDPVSINSGSTVLSAPEFSSTHSSSTNYAYLLRDYEGKLAVFEVGADEPFQVTDVRISTLPLVDQQALQAGIEAKDKAELTQLLNDFCS